MFNWKNSSKISLHSKESLPLMSLDILRWSWIGISIYRVLRRRHQWFMYWKERMFWSAWTKICLILKVYLNSGSVCWATRILTTFKHLQWLILKGIMSRINFSSWRKRKPKIKNATSATKEEAENAGLRLSL